MKRKRVKRDKAYFLFIIHNSYLIIHTLIFVFIFIIANSSCTSRSPVPPEVAYRNFVADFPNALLSDVQWIDLGTEKSLEYLGSGWGKPEGKPETGTFAYATGTQAEIHFWSNKPAPLSAGFGAQSFAYPGAQPQNVEVSVNGKPVGRFTLNSQFSNPVVNIPAEPIKVGDNTLTLKFAWAVSPSEVMPGSTDKRKLAAYFDYAIIFPSTEAAQLFIQRGVRVYNIASKGQQSEAIAMSAGSGVRFPDVPIAKDARLKFGIASTSSKGIMEILFKPEGESIVSLYRKEIPAGRAEPAFIDIDLKSVALKRGDLVFHVEPVDGKIADADFLWVSPQLMSHRPNVLLIVSDALRADKLGCYGGNVKTPNLDALARDGVLFENAFSQYPGTPPSFSTIFTGRIPPHHGVRLMSDSLSTEETTVATAMRGYIDHRGGFPALSILAANMGFAQGFTRYEMTRFTAWKRDSDAVNDEALPWIRENAQRGFFAFLHYADTHGPYAAPGSFEIGISAALDGKPISDQRINRTQSLEFSVDVPAGDHEFSIHAKFPSGCPKTEEGAHPLALTSITGSLLALLSDDDRRSIGSSVFLDPQAPLKIKLHNAGGSSATATLSAFTEVVGGGRNGCPGGDLLLAYEREVSYIDRQVGRTIGLLKELGVYNSTLVIFTSDHGEAFGEHGINSHIDGLYDEFIRVPLIVRAPWAMPKGKRIKNQVGLMDVAPTILDVLGLPQIKGDGGASLIRVIKDKLDRPLFSETVLNTSHTHLMGVRTSRWKLIRSDDNKIVELYDLVSDPGEHKNLVAGKPSEVRKLTEILNGLTKGKHKIEGREISDEVKARLKAMGYIK